MKVNITPNQMLAMGTAANGEAIRKIPHHKFAYFLMKKGKEADEIAAEINKLNEADQAKLPKMKEFEEKRIELCKEHAKKDDKGEPAIVPVEGKPGQGQYDIIDQDAFDKALEALRDEYKETLDERQKQVDKLNEFLNEEAERDLWAIRLDDLPDQITAELLAPFEKVITE